MKSKRVLIAPLDWGLGHATRCIPIIKEFLACSCEVIIAGSGSSLKLLQLEFTHLTCIELPAYGPVYPSTGSMALKMISQLPKFISVIKNEHNVVEKIVDDKHIDIVVSDNRFGCWSKKTINIFITHQVNIIMPSSLAVFQKMINDINHMQIRKFTECWIPDYAEKKSISGKLSRNTNFNAKYIGVLSRFNPCSVSRNGNYKNDVLVILSGPEPQRTILEDMLINQISKTNLKVFMVRGIPGKENKVVNGQFKRVDYMNGDELQETICNSEIIIARSGYSTIMDLSKLGKRAVFIPTPQQTEQEYLAEQLKIKRIAYFAPQHEFDLMDALKKVKDYTGFEITDQDHSLLSSAVARIVQ